MKPSIVFFGTGPVSRATLEGISGSFELEAIITKPAAGHGPAPVEEWAKQQGMKIFYPANSAELSELFASEHFNSQVGLVVDYGLIIPLAVIESFPKGIVNSHFSLLPELRGADPITAAILDGRTKTGVTLMSIVPALDEGPVLAQSQYEIPVATTTPELTTALVELSNKLIQDVLPRFIVGSVKAKKQDTKVTPTYTTKLSKQDGLIDWALPAATIERQIRALIGWPGSYTDLAGARVIITAVHLSDETGTPGKPFKLAGELAIACGKGSLVIDRIKPAGKQEMTGRAWLAGHSI